MRLVMIAFVVIPVIVVVVLKCRLTGGGMKFVVMTLREEMITNVASLEDEQQCHQRSDPPANQSWLAKAPARVALHSH